MQNSPVLWPTDTSVQSMHLTSLKPCPHKTRLGLEPCHETTERDETMACCRLLWHLLLPCSPAPTLSQLIPEQHHEGSTFIIIITTKQLLLQAITSSSPRTARSYSTFPIRSASVQGTHQRFQALRFRQVEEQIHLPLASMSFDPWLCVKSSGSMGPQILV